MCIVTAKEIGEMFKLSDATVYKLAAEGIIPGFRIGNSWRFDMEEILMKIKEQKIDAVVDYPEKRIVLTKEELPWEVN